MSNRKSRAVRLKDLLGRTKKNGECSQLKSERDGYGSVRINGKSMLSHRFVWMCRHGRIPRDMHVLHKCDNKRCVNIDHLFIGTHADNMRDYAMKKKPRGAGPIVHLHIALPVAVHRAGRYLLIERDLTWNSFLQDCIRRATDGYSRDSKGKKETAV